MMSSFVRSIGRRLAAAGAAGILALALLGGTASAFGGGGHGGRGFGHGGSGHGGGFTHGGGGFHGGGFGHDHGTFGRGHDGHGFHDRFGHFHTRGFVDGFVLAPFAFGYYGPYYEPTPYDTYCSPASPYYDPDSCYDYYDD
jgi:hypothetical protein